MRSMTPESEQNPTPATIRDAGQDDATRIAEAIGARLTVPEVRSDADPQDRLWLAEDEGAALIGLVGLRMVRDHSAEIHDLWVHPERRGQGVGVRLMEACLGYCRDHGVLKTVLQADENQTAAIHLFQKVGFMLARSRPATGGERLEFYMDLYHGDGGGDVE